MTTSPPLGWADRMSAAGSGTKVALMVALGIVLVTGAGIGTGLLVWQEPATTPTNATPALRSETDTTAMDGLDTVTRRATLGPGTLTMPPEPYVLYPDPVQLAGVIKVMFLANAEVHPDYEEGRDWQATVALAQLGSGLAGTDLERAGTRVLNELGREFYGGHRTKITHLQSADRAIDGRAGMEFRADVFYSAEGLASRYDRVVIWLVRGDDGNLVAAISSVPDDAPSQLAELAASAMSSLMVS